jgi:hypothetical protein
MAAEAFSGAVLLFFEPMGSQLRFEPEAIDTPLSITLLRGNGGSLLTGAGLISGITKHRVGYAI